MKTYVKRCFATGLIAASTLLCCLVALKASAQIASPTNYLAPVIAQMQVIWPKNRTVNIVFHGHSVPSGYFKTPAVDSLHAYPNLLRVALSEKYTNAVINVIVTAIGGEASDTQAQMVIVIQLDSIHT
jgi:hypothetical protein